MRTAAALFGLAIGYIPMTNSLPVMLMHRIVAIPLLDIDPRFDAE